MRFPGKRRKNFHTFSYFLSPSFRQLKIPGPRGPTQAKQILLAENGMAVFLTTPRIEIKLPFTRWTSQFSPGFMCKVAEFLIIQRSGKVPIYQLARLFLNYFITQQ